MPPKKKGAKSVAKPEPKKESPEKKDDELPRTRTRAKPAARSDSEELKGSKKIKKDEAVADLKKSKSKDKEPETKKESAK